MFGLGAQELIVIFIVLLLLFGGKKLPELARGLGKGIREFKKATTEIEEDLNASEIEEKSSKPKE
jgi:sec-independent protein translocase protein TatA